MTWTAAEYAAAPEVIDRLHRRILDLQCDRDRFGEALEMIRDADWVENCLDPQWAARIAREALC